MRHRRRALFAALAVLLLVLVGLVRMVDRTAPFPHKFAFAPGDGSVRPLFVLITQGQLHTNYITAAAGRRVPQVGYVHTFYYATQNSIQPASALRYWTGYHVWRALRRFALPDRFFGARSDGFAGTPLVLWLGYRGTNSIFSEQAALKSEQGLLFELTSGVENALTNSEHLMSWEIPLSLTNHGKYRLILPNGNRTLLTFVYK